MMCLDSTCPSEGDNGRGMKQALDRVSWYRRKNQKSTLRAHYVSAMTVMRTMWCETLWCPALSPQGISLAAAAPTHGGRHRARGPRPHTPSRPHKNGQNLVNMLLSWPSTEKIACKLGAPQGSLTRGLLLCILWSNVMSKNHTLGKGNLRSIDQWSVQGPQSSSEGVQDGSSAGFPHTGPTFVYSLVKCDVEKPHFG